MATNVWKGHLSFGLVSFPVHLTVAARGESVSFNQLHKCDGSRVKMVMYCQKEDKPITRDEIVKGFEYEKDRYVVLDEADIKKVAPKTARTMEILQFVKAETVDPVYLESSYYVGPEEGGAKAYGLLFQAMRNSGYYGIAKVTMHNREHIVILRPCRHGMMLHTMFYRDEVRSADEFRTDTNSIQEKELKLAELLIDSLAGDFEPENYQDTYRENLKAMIQAKIEGRAITEAPVVEAAPVTDLFEALTKSLERKPATKATRAEPEVKKATRKRA